MTEPTEGPFAASDSGGGWQPMTSEVPGTPAPLDFGDADTEVDAWPERPAARGVRLRVPTAVLLALLVAGGAFWGGAALEKSHGSASSGFAGLAARFGRGAAGSAASGSAATTGSSATSGSASKSTTGGFGGFGGFGGASTAAATGTVTVVEGNTLFVTTSSGSIVKVTVGSTAKVTRNATANAASLKPGDTVVVQGTTSKDGTVTASSVAATEAGVSAASAFGR